MSPTFMTVKPPSLDYEPLKRATSEFVVEDGAEAVFKSPRKFSDDAAVDWPAQPENAAPRRPAKDRKSALEPAPETWIHKHGHSLSFAGIFLFTAFVFFRPYEFSPSLMWLSKAAFWIALATLVIFLLTQLGLENRFTARPREVNLILLFLATAILSIPLALEPSKAFDAFVEFFKVVLIFVVMVNVVRTETRLKTLWILVLIASCILCINGVNDYRTGELALHGVRIKGSIGGLFDNPNDLALHLVTMFPIALALAFGSRYLLSKIIFFGIALLIVAGIVVTFSRGGFLALLAASGLLLWKLVRSTRWLMLPVAGALVILFILVAPGGYKARLSTTEDDSATARFDDFKRSIFVAARHPVFGVGMDNYVLFSNSNKVSHNAYTQVAAEMGVAALAFYILFILAPFKRLRSVERQSFEIQSQRRFYYASAALQASLLGYMVASFFASVAYLWYIYYLVAYAVCLRRIYDSVVEQNRENKAFPSQI
jgi:probable O-glycosylation ligase (exosortase A-associated)